MKAVSAEKNTSVFAPSSGFAPVVLWLGALVAGCSSGNAVEQPPVAQQRAAQVVCAAGETVEGIDVSKWQASIDWNAVATTDVKFAITRLSYGTSKDSYFDANWGAMKQAGLVRGFYQYFLAEEDPIAQADLVISAMGGQIGEMELPPVIDLEGSGNENVSNALWISSLTAWVQHVEAALGRKPIIYVGRYFWQDHFAIHDFDSYPLWIPYYDVACPDLLDGYFPNWLMWQYTSTGSVSGISGNVDRDLFQGSYADLLAITGPGTKPYAAQFVAQSFPFASEPTLQIVSGGALDAYIDMKNVGTATWDSNTRLATTVPRDRDSVFAGPEWPGPNRYAQVEGNVPPGETYRFNFTLHAPADLGVYDEHFGLVQEGVAWFSDAGQGGPLDDQLEGRFEVVAGSTGGASGSAGEGGSTSGAAGSSGLSGASASGGEAGANGANAGASGAGGSGGSPKVVTISFAPNTGDSGGCAVSSHGAQWGVGALGIAIATTLLRRRISTRKR